jgi:hypothetical protein
MPSKLPSFIRFHQCLNAIATAFLRRAFAGAIRAQRPLNPTGDGPARSIKSDSTANRSVSLNRSRTIKTASGI